MANDGGSSSHLSTSLTDLMISLMVIFVLLLVVHLNNKSAEAENTRKKAENAREILLNEFTDKFEKFAAVPGEEVTVRKDDKDPFGILVIVPEKLFNFKTADDTIPPGGIVFLQDFAPLLAELACDEHFKNDISSIVVEGHADSDGNDVVNFDLSLRRAGSVVREILKNTEGQRELEECFLDCLSAAGRGKRDLLKDDGEENKDRSRRVVLKVRARSPDEIQRFLEK